MQELQPFKVYLVDSFSAFILGQPCCQAKECPPDQPIFAYNIKTIKENSPTSLAHSSVFDDPNDFKFAAETCYVLLQGKTRQNLEEIDHNLYHHILMMSYENHKLAVGLT